jgi:hypothetical protein
MSKERTRASFSGISEMNMDQTAFLSYIQPKGRCRCSFEQPASGFVRCLLKADTFARGEKSGSILTPPLISRQPGDRLCLDYFAPDRRASDRCLHTTATRPTFVLSVAQRKLAPEVRVLARLRTRSPACAPDPPSHATSRAQVSFRTGSGRVLEANARHHHDREC